MKFKQRFLNKVRLTHSKGTGGAWIVVKKTTMKTINIASGGALVGMGLLVLSVGYVFNNIKIGAGGLIYTLLGLFVVYWVAFKKK